MTHTLSFSKHEEFERFYQAMDGLVNDGISIENTASLAKIAKSAGWHLGTHYNDFKELHDLSEVALNVYVSRIDIKQTKPHEVVRKLSILQNLLPKRTERSVDQIEYQQFSTPLPLAYLMLIASGLKAEDTFFEPSAGTGNIAAMALTLCPEHVYVNELHSDRLELLKSFGFKDIYIRKMQLIFITENDFMTYPQISLS